MNMTKVQTLRGINKGAFMDQCAEPAVVETTPAARPLAVRDAVYRLLRAFGMTTVFGNPGSTELPLFMNFPDDFRYVLGLQECVVVGMADGYAQATHNAAFINLHSAAGVGHAMGNIFTAYKNQTPLVITAGQQARSILPFDPFLGSTQAPDLPKPYVKWSIEPARAEDVPLAIARAYYIAMTPPRGPVLVSIPSDDWEVETLPVDAREVSRHLRADPDLLARVAQALDAARAPAFVVGAAVDRDRAWDEAVRLAERHNARVYVAPMSGRCSFPEDHPLWAGFLPPMRERIVDRLAGHDLVFAVGAPAFTYHVEGNGPHLPAGAKLVQLTDDPQVAARAPTGTSVVSSIRLGLRDLLELSAPRPRETPPPHVRPPHVAEPELGERLPVDWVLQTLNELRPRDSIVVEEAPSARPVMHGHLPIFETETFYTMCSGGLGYGLPAAMGVAMGKPNARVIALIGDGSAMYAIQALWSAAQLGLPVTTVILKNRRYAALHEFARIFGYRPDEPIPGTDLPDLDFVALATAQGMQGLRIETAAQFRQAFKQALTATRPTLLEVEVA
jgi:benzoylformate decarboxylase